MRSISFMLTQEQVKNRTKTVTRRHGWRFLKVGDLLQGVDRCQGLKKGEHPVKLCVIRVESVTFEPLSHMTAAETILEGFPEMSVGEFIDMFCKSHKGVTPLTEVTRIEFSYVEESPMTANETTPTTDHAQPPNAAGDAVAVGGVTGGWRLSREINMSNSWDWNDRHCDYCGEIIEECICHDLAGYVDNYEEEFYQMKPTDIEINGQDIQINGNTLTYEQIVKFAGLNEALNPSVVYKRGGGTNADGVMCRGEILTLKDGTKISAFVTGNA